VTFVVGTGVELAQPFQHQGGQWLVTGGDQLRVRRKDSKVLTHNLHHVRAKIVRRVKGNLQAVGLFLRPRALAHNESVESGGSRVRSAVPKATLTACKQAIRPAQRDERGLHIGYQSHDPIRYFRAGFGQADSAHVPLWPSDQPIGM